MPSDFQTRLLEFYKDRYESEMDRRDKATLRLNLNLAALTIVANIILSYLNNLPQNTPSCWTTILSMLFFGLLTLAIIFAFVGVYYFLRGLALGRHEYFYLPSPEKIRTFLVDTEKYNQEVPAKAVDLESEFIKNLTDQYCEYSTKNFEANNPRSTFIYKASYYSAISLIFLMVASPFFFIKKFTSKKSPHSIEIVKPIPSL